MAAGTWKIYAKAKKGLGNGTITLNSGVFKMQLHRVSASATILALSTRSLASSIVAEISATGGYVAAGRAIAGVKWTVGASAKQIKWTYTTAGLVFTANAAALSGGASGGIKYALLRNSTGAGVGRAICFCTLSTAAFVISTGNTLTISPQGTGVFTLS